MKTTLILAVALAALATLAGAFACTPFKRFAYSGPGRDRWQQPDRVVEALGIEPGTRIADLGSGGGYFTFRLAEATGSGGRVYAADIDEGLNRYVARKAEREGVAQVRVVLAEPADPKLPEPVDLVFTCNTYHHLPDRVAYFERLRKNLRPGGRVAVVEYKEGGWFSSHATPAETIERELGAAGYRLERRHIFLERQSFLVFAAD